MQTSSGLQTFNSRGVADPLDVLLRMLSDGQEHFLADLAEVLQEDHDTIFRMLDVLENGGLRLHRSRGGFTTDAFQPLDAIAIETTLVEMSLNADVFVLSLTDSTNSQLLAAFRTNAMSAEMTVLASELQQAGRGRLGRVWHSSPGASLTVSFALIVPVTPADLSGFSLMCGLAARDALLRHGVEGFLKWPNDLLSSGGKLGGILVETQKLNDGGLGVVIGIGINVAGDEGRDHALAGREIALAPTDMGASGAHLPVDRNRLVADLAQCLSNRIEVFKRHGFAPMVWEWNSAHAFQDEQVSMIDDGKVMVTGKALGVDDFGRLLLETGQGVRTLISGDVSLRAG
jgi:BirA family biotin operon repressor/biotin-[acetyl-CoA-carboxylase] ligase